jgi:hypothetical protein
MNLGAGYQHQKSGNAIEDVLLFGFWPLPIAVLIFIGFALIVSKNIRRPISYEIYFIFLTYFFMASVDRYLFCCGKTCDPNLHLKPEALVL